MRAGSSRGEKGIGVVAHLRPGDVVEVRSEREILATLDENGARDAMPFMPEMLRYAGKRFTVSRRVEKICDTVSNNHHISRRMRDTVYLDDLRCDGSGHGGCQAGCKIYWKEAWLKRVDPTSPTEIPGDDETALAEVAAASSKRPAREVDGQLVDVYRCQATEAERATTVWHKYDPRQYLGEVYRGNVGFLHFLRVAARGLSIDVRSRLGRMDFRPLPYHDPPAATTVGHDLESGDLVQVRSPDEIADTLDKTGKTRGLWFDTEMLPYCGGTYRVQDRVERIIDEGTGEMIELHSDCLILQGVSCSGERSIGRWFCPRAIYPYWREAWLKRVEDESKGLGDGPAYSRTTSSNT